MADPGPPAAPIEVLDAADLVHVRPLILDLMLEEQRGYDHRQLSRDELDAGLLGEVRPGFDGENVVLAVRDAGGIVGVCWCVLFNPGTGLEGEVAEVYVRPGYRGRGLAVRLLRAAVELFATREVTFASVWTHPGNAAATRLYERAGFRPTEQLVMTWLPEGDSRGGH